MRVCRRPGRHSLQFGHWLVGATRKLPRALHCLRRHVPDRVWAYPPDGEESSAPGFQAPTRRRTRACALKRRVRVDMRRSTMKQTTAPGLLATPSIPRRKPLASTIGVFGVGRHSYWPQFDGLLDDMKRKLALFVNKVRAHGGQVIDFGIADDARSAYSLRSQLKAASLDLIFCDMLTYATSAAFGVIARDLDVPIVLVALQPMKALDYSRASTFMQLSNDDFCAVPEFAGVAIRMGRRPPPVILGTLDDDPAADAEIADWCRIACVLHDLKRARIGHFGHVLENMLDMQTDPTALTAAFGCHIVETEPDDLMRQFRLVSDADAEAKKRQILEIFETPDPKSDPITRKLIPADLDLAARVAVALER